MTHAAVVLPGPYLLAPCPLATLPATIYGSMPWLCHLAIHPNPPDSACPPCSGVPGQPTPYLHLARAFEAMETTKKRLRISGEALVPLVLQRGLGCVALHLTYTCCTGGASGRPR